MNNNVPEEIFRTTVERNNIIISLMMTLEENALIKKGIFRKFYKMI